MAAKPLKHTDVSLGKLMTYSSCADALEGMEMCASNVVGGNKAFSSGKQTFFTATAHKKYSAIQAKMKRLAEQLSDEEDSDTPDMLATDLNGLIATLKKLHPELQWGEFPLGDYDQYAEADAPEVLVCFGNGEGELDEGLVDPYSTLMGERCEPSHWGLSEPAAQLIQAHNKVFIAKYPNCDGPRQRES
jgi:hypothetical protein